tara:strand:- start:3467 stop:3697 length:231 start_codon:yes stop_codon:yes gene_type:complete
MQNIKAAARAWERGDLVKIKASTWGGRSYDALGVLINVSDEDETKNLFPSALVFDMYQQKIKQFYLYDLELLSSAT